MRFKIFSMKLFSFVLSVLIFFISIYFFILKIPEIYSFNDIIYIALLAILMMICIVGILVNAEVLKNLNKLFKRE